MRNEDKVLENLVTFLQETEQYLHSWCCTRTGKYLPVDMQNVRTVLMELVSNGSKNPITDFKKGIENGTINESISCIALTDESKKTLYERHRENIKNFEKKYKI